jgi:hypothetical protein
MFLYEAAGILVVASPLPPEGKGALMRELLLPLMQRFSLYLDEVCTSLSLCIFLFFVLPSEHLETYTSLQHGNGTTV